MQDTTAQPYPQDPSTAALRDQEHSQEEKAQKEEQEDKQLEQELLTAQTIEQQYDSGKGVMRADTPDVDKFERDVERDLLFQILRNMRRQEISLDEAQRLAQEFLSLLPVNDKYELLKKLNELGQDYSEAEATYLKYALPLEEEKRTQALQSVTEHLRSGNIEQAIAAVKGASSNGSS